MTEDHATSETLGYAGPTEEEGASKAEQARAHRRRDAEALTIIGAFFAVLSVMVLIGVVLHHEVRAGLIVGLIAGVLLLAAGIGAIRIGMRLRRDPD